VGGTTPFPRRKAGVGQAADNFRLPLEVPRTFRAWYPSPTVPTPPPKVVERHSVPMARTGRTIVWLRRCGAGTVAAAGALGAVVVGGGVPQAPEAAIGVLILLVVGLALGAASYFAGRHPRARAIGQESPQPIPWTPIVVGLGVGSTAFRMFQRFAPVRYARRGATYDTAQEMLGALQQFTVGMHEVSSEERPARIDSWRIVTFLGVASGAAMVWLAVLSVPTAATPWLPGLWFLAGLVGLAVGAIWRALALEQLGAFPRRWERGMVVVGAAWTLVAASLLGCRLDLWLLAIAGGAAPVGPALAQVALAGAGLLVPEAYLLGREAAARSTATLPSSHPVTG
jgi:hypothetical protein